MSAPGRPVRPGARPRPECGARGFTLLEVVVALAILSLAVVAGLQLFAGGLRLVRLAGEHQQAALIADAKTRAVAALVEGRETGTEAGFTWERTIQRREVPAELVVTTAKPYAVYAVTVRVSWAPHRSVEIATLRTAHPAGPTDAATAPTQLPFTNAATPVPRNP